MAIENKALINESVDSMVAPRVDPNALGTIQGVGIKLYQVASGTTVEGTIKAITSGTVGQFRVSMPPTALIVLMIPTTSAPAYGCGFGCGRVEEEAGEQDSATARGRVDQAEDF